MHGFFRGHQRLEDGLSFAIDDFPRRGQGEIFAFPDQKLGAKDQFQPLHLRRHTGLGRVFPVGGPTKGLFLIDRDKGLQSANLDAGIGHGMPSSEKMILRPLKHHKSICVESADELCCTKPSMNGLPLFPDTFIPHFFVTGMPSWV